MPTRTAQKNTWEESLIKPTPEEAILLRSKAIFEQERKTANKNYLDWAQKRYYELQKIILRAWFKIELDQLPPEEKNAAGALIYNRARKYIRAWILRHVFAVLSQVLVLSIIVSIIFSNQSNINSMARGDNTLLEVYFVCFLVLGMINLLTFGQLYKIFFRDLMSKYHGYCLDPDRRQAVLKHSDIKEFLYLHKKIE